MLEWLQELHSKDPYLPTLLAVGFSIAFVGIVSLVIRGKR